jgi:hypothetical protein
MGNFLDGIQYPVMAGFGAVAGLVIGVPILAALGFIWPVLWGGWLFSPVAVGAVAGLVFAGFMK